MADDKKASGSDPPANPFLFSAGGIEALSDRELLERFTAGEGELAQLAFTVIVERHGPMVLGVCKAIVGDEDTARDVFQATFLILLHKAHSLWVQDSLGPGSIAWPIGLLGGPSPPRSGGGITSDVQRS